MNTQLEEHFDRFAPSYDRVNHILSIGLDVRWRSRLIESIEQRPRLKILDLCAGTLACTREALRRYPDSKAIAVDFCRPMLDHGLSRLDELQKGRVKTICADVVNLDFAPASFDAVITCWGMRHVSDQEKMLRKIKTWLVPEGQLIVADFFRPSTAVSKIFHATIGRYVLPAAATMLSGMGEAYKYLHYSIDHFWTRHEYEQILNSHGFAVRRAENLTFGIVSLIVAENARR